MWICALASIGSLSGSFAPAYATAYVATPADVATKLAALAPGDVLELRADAGNYVGGLTIVNLNGTALLPITIRGPVSGARPIIEGTTTTNVISIRSSSYIAIQNLEIDGKNRVGDGISADGGNCPHDVLIENIYIHDIEADQQNVAISANGCSGSSWNWTIRGNRIVGIGTGMYLGNSDGSRQFFAGVIEYNTIIDTIGYNIEIKHQNPRPTVVGMPTGDSRTIIRHNVFSKSVATSSGGANARPNLLVGHMPLSGAGQNDRYEIYGNFFFQNPVEVLFQGEGNIYFYNNVLYNSLGTAIAIQAQNGVPRDVHVFNNTVVASDTGISISGGASGYVQEVFGNAVFAGTPLSGGARRDNVTDTFAQASTYLNNPSATIALLDLFPKAALTGSVIDYASVSAPTGSTLGAGTEWNKDFNSTTQPGNVRGAYVGSGVNPGWKLALTRKPAVGGSLPPPPPPPGVPTVSLAVSPATVALNGVATLSWLSDGTSCAATAGGWSGAQSVQGSQQVGPLTANTHYELTCSNSSGSTSSAVTVTIVPAPVVTLSATPPLVFAGTRTMLSWNATNAISCTAGGGWAGNKAVSGTEQSPVLMTTQDFSLVCDGPGGPSASTAINVQVTPGPPPPLGNDVLDSPKSGGGATAPLTLACLAAFAAAGSLNRSRV
jgi:hypothetical protein